MRKNHGWAAFWQKKQYIIAGTLVILAAVGMTVLYSRGQEQERKQLEQEIAAEMDSENPEPECGNGGRDRGRSGCFYFKTADTEHRDSRGRKGE